MGELDQSEPETRRFPSFASHFNEVSRQPGGQDNQTEPPTRRFSGFASRFAAVSRQSRDDGTSSPGKRVVAISAVVALVLGGSIGVGALVSSQHKSTTATAAHVSRTTSPAGVSTKAPPHGKTGQQVSALQNQNAALGGHVEQSNQKLTGADTPVGTGGTAGDSADIAPAAGSNNTVPGGSHIASSNGGQSSGHSGGSGSTNTSQSTGPQQPPPAPLVRQTTQQTHQNTIVQVPVHLIQGYGSSRCIDVKDGSTAAGATLQIWDCTGAQWQQWSFPSDGTVRSMGECMAVQNGSLTNGTPIVMEPCNGSSAEQFRLNAAHDLTRSNMCVDAKDKQTSNGTALQLWACGGTSNQKWHLA